MAAAAAADLSAADLSADFAAAGLSAGLAAAVGAAPGSLDGDGAVEEAAEVTALAGFFSALLTSGDEADDLARGPPPLRFLGAGPLLGLGGDGDFLLAALLLRGELGTVPAGDGGFLLAATVLPLRGLLRGDVLGAGAGAVSASTSILSSSSLVVEVFASRLARR